MQRDLYSIYSYIIYATFKYKDVANKCFFWLLCLRSSRIHLNMESALHVFSRSYKCVCYLALGNFTVSKQFEISTWRNNGFKGDRYKITFTHQSECSVSYIKSSLTFDVCIPIVPGAVYLSSICYYSNHITANHLHQHAALHIMP